MVGDVFMAHDTIKVINMKNYVCPYPHSCIHFFILTSLQRRMETDLLIKLSLCKYPGIQSLKPVVILKIALEDNTVFVMLLQIAEPVSGPLFNNSSWKPG